MESSATHCPVHLSARAAFTCERCGTFGCETCRAEGAPYLCRPCAQRSGVGVLRLEAVLQEAWSVVRGHPGRTLAMGAAYGVLALLSLPFYRRMFEAQARMEAQVAAASRPGGAPPDIFGTLVDMYASIGWLLLLTMPVGILLTAAFLTHAGHALRGETRAPGALLGEALRRSPALLGTTLVTGLLLVAGLVMCIVPGLGLGVMLAFAWPASVVGGAGPLEAVSRSWTLARKHLLPVFLTVLVAAGAMFAAGLVSNLFTLLFKPVGLDAQLVGTVLGQVLTGVMATFPYAMLTAAYLRLVRAEGAAAAVVR